MIPVRRLNHAVLFVRDVERSSAFYREVFGFEEVTREAGGQAAFMRAAGSDNHHDLGLFQVGPQAPASPPGGVGLYHLAWQVEDVRDLVSAREELARVGALRGQSDHGATKSLYGVDPDGHEFEIMWLVPRQEWGEFERRAVVEPLDLDREVARHAATEAG